MIVTIIESMPLEQTYPIFPLKVNTGLIQTKDVQVTQNMFIATSNEVPPVYFQRTKRFDYLLFPINITLCLVQLERKWPFFVNQRMMRALEGTLRFIHPTMGRYFAWQPLSLVLVARTRHRKALVTPQERCAHN